MPVRRSLLAMGVAALVLAAVAAYLLLPPRQSAEVAVPAADATPDEVVTAYLDALAAHDCDTAAALSDPDSGALGPACDDLASVTDVRVSAPRVAGPRRAEVPVELDLRWRPLRGDGTLGPGPTAWGYVLARADASAPWRIVDQGTG